MSFDFSTMFSRVLVAGASVAQGLKQAHIGGQADEKHYDQAMSFIEVLAGLYQAFTAPPAKAPEPPAVEAPQVS